MKTNFLRLTDGYKPTHWPQYPQGTTKVHSFLEARSAPRNVMFFGLQYLLKEYFLGKVFNRPDLDTAARRYKNYFGADYFNYKGWEHILILHGGKLPLKIWAVPEGKPYPARTPLMAVENTCPDCYWLTNYVETLLVQTWYGSTVGTNTWAEKISLWYYLTETGDPSGLPFKNHDFGFRGVSSVESAAIGGAAHLVNFMGSDTVVALDMIADYYGEEENVGFSIPAAEHSTITSWMQEHERDAFANMLEKFPTGLVAVVSDSYDIYNAVDNLWGTQLHDQVMNREGTLVVRPDSGDPVTVVEKVISGLADKFGAEKNVKGYKVLDPHVRVIQGDGIDMHSMVDILENLKLKGWSADNIAFGEGGAKLQRIDRDTYSFAMKASVVVVNGEERSVHKNPITDPGKASTGGYKQNGMDLVFEDGVLLRDTTFSDIRKAAQI